MSWFGLALDIAAEAHYGQKDKAGEDYLLHPLRVASSMETDIERTTAILHDVIEDSKTTIDDLNYHYGFPDEILEAVITLTRKRDETYEDYILRIARNSLAVKIKLADLEDNLDIKRLGALSEKDLPRLNRYLSAWKVLKVTK